jgi:hypothetical protein
MKTLVISIPLFFAGFSSDIIFAGASYYFCNNVPRTYVPGVSIDAPVFDATGNRLEGTNYVAMLYGGRTTDSLAPAWFLEGYPMAPVPFTRYSVSGQAGYFWYPGWVEIMTVGGSGTAWL